MRFRYIYMLLAFVLFPLMMFIADPDVGIITNMAYGAQFVQFLLNSLGILMFVGILHLSRKALFDYVNMEEFKNKALETAEGAGLFMGGMGVSLLAIAVVIHAVLTATSG